MHHIETVHSSVCLMHTEPYLIRGYKPKFVKQNLGELHM